ncbi:MAG: hypothetical protein ACT4PZ_09645 [Panacagrimonas sp.]
MSPSSVTEFQIDRNAVRRAGQRRLLFRAGFAGVLVALFGAAVSAWVPESRGALAWSFALTVIAVYAGVEVSAMQWARRSAPTMVLRLTPTTLECWIGPGHYALAYRDLTITRLHASRNAVRSIELRNAKGEKVVLAGFCNMDALAQALTANIAGARADSGGPR